MLAYAGATHSAILDALDTQISDEQWETILADAQPVGALRAELAAIAAHRSHTEAPLGAYFPGWHGITEVV